MLRNFKLYVNSDDFDFSKMLTIEQKYTINPLFKSRDQGVPSIYQKFELETFE